MAAFPPIAHVALTVRELSVSVPWYEALLDAQAVLDEDTDPDFHHTVYLIGDGQLIGLHQHVTPAPNEGFSEFRIGLDHVAFGCANRQNSKRGHAGSMSSASPTMGSRMRPTAQV